MNRIDDLRGLEGVKKISGDLFTRWMRLDWRRRRLLVEAMVAVAAASAAVRFVRFNRAVRLGARRVGAANTRDVSAEVSWAVETVARKLPWRAVCFQQGLAVQWMLRRRGIDAMLHYGIALDSEGQLKSHVWVAAGDSVIIGGAEAPRFKCVATYP